MINANELRIGNFVNFRRQPQRLHSFNNDLRLVDFGTDRAYWGPPANENPAKDIEPIKLTPEILTEWCGAEDFEWDFIGKDSLPHKMKGQFILLDTAFRMKLLFTDEGYLLWQVGEVSVVLRHPNRTYLHTLQNIYFGLVGKELEIKIPGRVATH